jgi:hypothetical protein
VRERTTLSIPPNDSVALPTVRTTTPFNCTRAKKS